MRTKLILIFLVTTGILLISISQFNLGSKFEDKNCIKNPTLECVHEIILRYGVHNILSPLERMMNIPIRDNQFSEDQFAIINKNYSKPFDAAEVEKNYPIGKERLEFVHDLVKKVIRQSEYGAGYPYYGDASQRIIGFLEEKTFSSVVVTPALLSLITYWKDSAKKLEGDDGNDHLLRIAKLWMSLGKIEQAKNILIEMQGLSKLHSYAYINLLKSLQKLEIKFSVDAEVVVTEWRAELLTLLNRNDEAITLLLNEKKEIITDFEGKETKAGSVDRLKYIARILAKAGASQEALLLVDQIYDIYKTDIVLRSFINNDEFSNLYRDIGQRQKAISLMTDYLNRDNYRTCKSFNTSGDHAQCATELVYLGFPDKAYEKVQKHCHKNTNCWAILDMYVAALETNAELPDIEKISYSFSKDRRAWLYLKLSVLHFKNKDIEYGNHLLEQAVNEMPRSRRNIGRACKTAYVANLFDRKDLLEPLFKNTIQLIYSKGGNIEDRMYNYESVFECFKEVSPW